MPKFITLAGKKQVGKDTSAHMLKELLVPVRVEKQPNGCMDALFEEGSFAKKVHIIHFADALKQACNIVFGIDLRDMETEEGKVKPTHIIWPCRSHSAEPWSAFEDWMQPNSDALKAGQPMTVREVLQFVGTNLFRNQIDPDVWVKSVYRRSYGDQDVVIVADCRFPNEANFARKHGVLIKIERETGLQGDSHVSETALDDFSDYHYIVDNNKGFDDLKASLRVVLEQEDLL